MRYFIDTEFREGPQDKTFLGFKYGETKPTIDLISIGIVCEDDRYYYAVCNEFNIDQAWNDEWLRKNVLMKIFYEFAICHYKDLQDYSYDKFTASEAASDKSSFKKMIKLYGRSKSQIAKEVQEFVFNGLWTKYQRWEPEFWAYYADYDWVVFCWIFGRMLDLPKGFPMYCRDVKQVMDQVALLQRTIAETNESYSPSNVDEGLAKIKAHPGYPVNKKEHHALHDAKFDKDLFNFLTRTNL